MENIERMKPSQTYEVMDLWLRTTIHSNSFVEENFWETHYDFVKEKYINGKENFVYIIDGKIVAFTGVTEDNRITGLFVDPEYQNKGIGTALINFLNRSTICSTYLFTQETERLLHSQPVPALSLTVHFATNITEK